MPQTIFDCYTETEGVHGLTQAEAEARGFVRVVYEWRGDYGMQRQHYTVYFDSLETAKKRTAHWTAS